MNIESPVSWIPGLFTRTRIARIAVIHWLAVLVGLPLFHLAMVLLNRLLSRLVGRRRRNPDLSDVKILSGPLRVFLLVATIRWTLSKTAMPLIARQV
jgi:hypothetical protein